jgi:hypothetical protein
MKKLWEKQRYEMDNGERRYYDKIQSFSDQELRAWALEKKYSETADMVFALLFMTFIGIVVGISLLIPVIEDSHIEPMAKKICELKGQEYVGFETNLGFSMEKYNTIQCNETKHMWGNDAIIQTEGSDAAWDRYLC